MERTFDYENVLQIYQKMQKIVGDTGDKDSIAGILYLLDEDIHENIDVEEEAISGELGRKILLDWNNTSANFKEFISNFQNWAALISKTADNYKQFEEQVNGLKTSNPLGITSQITEKTTNGSSYYENYTNDSLQNSLSSSHKLNEVTGLENNTTNSTSNLSKNAGTLMGVAGASLALGVLPAVVRPLTNKQTSNEMLNEKNKNISSVASYVTQNAKGIVTLYNKDN